MKGREMLHAAGRGLWIGITATVIAGCTVIADGGCRSNASCVAPALELYYKETPGIEPWAATADGSLVSGWRDAAIADMKSASLDPTVVELAKVEGGGHVTYALQVRVPDGQRAIAAGRCFVANVRDSAPPAAQRTDCTPFYTTQR